MARKQRICCAYAYRFAAWLWGARDILPDYYSHIYSFFGSFVVPYGRFDGPEEGFCGGVGLAIASSSLCLDA
jgi:hypothetical protein